jgi:PAS domain S-box-containing protein
MSFGDYAERHHAQDSDRRSDSHYRTLFNSIDEGFCIIEVLFDGEGKPQDYRFVETNAAFEATTGLKEATGKRMRELAPHHEQHWFDIYGQIALTRQPARFEERAAALHRWYDVYAFPFGTPEEHQVAILFDDITQRKEAEEALRASEELNRSVLESSPDCINILDCEGRLQFINRNGLRLLELEDFTAIAHQPWVELWGEENKADVQKALDQACRGQPAQFQAFSRTGRGSAKFWDVMIAPIVGGKGSGPGSPPTRLISVARDVTQAREREAETSRSEQRFRSLVSVVTDIPWMSNAAGEFITLQPAWTRYTGQTWEQYRGFGWLEALHPEDRVPIFELWQKSCQKQSVFEVRGRLFHARSGEYRHFKARAVPLLHRDGSIREWIGSCSDVHDEKLVSEHLERTVNERTARLQETIGDLEAFSYSIAHDMRAPLRAMQGFATILSEDSKQLGVEARECIRRIISAADRMDKLIQDVLDYSRVVRADLPLKAVDVERLLRGIVESYPQFQLPHGEIVIEGIFPRVLANEAALTQCISNLLSNPIKFVAPGVIPRVRVWAERREGRVHLFFEDNGIGIKPEWQEKIFAIFQQLSKSSEGTGIGLAIVKKAVHRMNGQVGVRSEPGKGSTFWLDLALAPEP